MDKINLKDRDGNNFKINRKLLEDDLLSLDDFVESLGEFNNFQYAKHAMFETEIKANNDIEGLNDLLDEIKKVIENKERSSSRILNLYKGYLYILENKDINKESVRKLYNILSNNLLNEHDSSLMGKYYRKAPVYILNGASLTKEPFLGVDSDKINEYMDLFFEFENSNILEDSDISNFMKSQIMQFYFVYIHPYFDVNGRTSRTVGMWKLLNNKNYPYIIFNRAISNNKSGYEKSIIKGRKTSDMTYFLKYMTESVRKTLEMEVIVNSIINKSKYHITRDDSEMIEYILMMNGYLTLKDLEEEYNRHNDTKNRFKLYKENIKPLIDKDIILLKDKTRNGDNYFFKLNSDLVDIGNNKMKTLKLDKYI